MMEKFRHKIEYNRLSPCFPNFIFFLSNFRTYIIPFDDRSIKERRFFSIKTENLIIDQSKIATKSALFLYSESHCEFSKKTA